jgi:hypothetical protein
LFLNVVALKTGVSIAPKEETKRGKEHEEKEGRREKMQFFLWLPKGEESKGGGRREKVGIEERYVVINGT